MTDKNNQVDLLRVIDILAEFGSYLLSEQKQTAASYNLSRDAETAGEANDSKESAHDDSIADRAGL